MKFFQTLGSVVGDRWKSQNYNEEIFPEIASQALAELPPAHYVSAWDVAKWATTADQLPLQDDIEARFGDPPLTVYIGRKFRIEVLFWAKGVPAIHQHGFSGAFHVMHGSSIHTLWTFEPLQQVEVRLVLGRVAFKSAEILLKGESRPILSGHAMFHATYHVNRPSISVVIRTLSEANKQPQYSLLPPSLAYDQKNELPTVTRQTQILRMLIEARKRSELQEIVRHLCATKDAYSIFRFLHSIFPYIEDDDERFDLLTTVRLKHAALVDALHPALVHEEMGNKLLNLCEEIGDGELRFFLALLRNLPRRNEIIRLIKHRFPDRDPVAAIVTWLRSLSESGLLPTGLGEHTLLIVRNLLQNSPAERIRCALREKFPEQAWSDGALGELCTILGKSWLLSSLRLANPFNLDAIEP